MIHKPVLDSCYLASTLVIKNFVQKTDCEVFCYKPSVTMFLCLLALLALSLRISRIENETWGEKRGKTREKFSMKMNNVCVSVRINVVAFCYFSFENCSFPWNGVVRKRSLEVSFCGDYCSHHRIEWSVVQRCYRKVRALERIPTVYLLSVWIPKVFLEIHIICQKYVAEGSCLSTTTTV